MNLSEAPETRRAKGELPGSDPCAIHGDGEVDAGVADIGVVEEVMDASFEGIRVQQPSTKGKLETELVFFVALPMERPERGDVALSVNWPTKMLCRRPAVRVSQAAGL